MPSKFGLLPPDIENRVQALPGRPAGIDGLAAVWLSGSFARGEGAGCYACAVCGELWE